MYSSAINTHILSSTPTSVVSLARQVTSEMKNFLEMLKSIGYHRNKNYPNMNGVIFTTHTFLFAIPISLNFIQMVEVS